MKGAMAEPSVMIIKAPNNTRKIMIGANHHFLRCLRKSQNSKSIDSLDKLNPHFFESNGKILSNLSLLVSLELLFIVFFY